MPTAHEHLRAFEDETLGHDVERHHGKIEKGSGSRFAKLPPEHRKRHAALEHLIEAEHEVAKAQAALDAAVAHHAAAAQRAEVDLEAPEPESEPVQEPAAEDDADDEETAQ